MNKIILTIAGSLLSAAAFCQTNFNGNWKLTNKEFISGPEYGNAVADTVSITQTKDSIYIGRIAFPANGKQLTVKRSRKFVLSMGWSADKTQLITTTVFYIPENDNQVDFTRVDTYSISNGELSLYRKSEETRSETWEAKGVYEKL